MHVRNLFNFSRLGRERLKKNLKLQTVFWNLEQNNGIKGFYLLWFYQTGTNIKCQKLTQKYLVDKLNWTIFSYALLWQSLYVENIVGYQRFAQVLSRKF